MTVLRTSQLRPGPATYGGLFLTTLSTLMYEILLTRIFSVTMWYHFAFVAVSVALFGLTVGALIVHLVPRWFTDEQTKERLFQAALLFSIFIVVSFVTQLSIPFDPRWSVVSMYSIGFTFLVISIPFIFSGIAVTLALTKFPTQVGRLYAADLIGAGLGTIMVIWMLRWLDDGPSAVIGAAALAAVGATMFAYGAGRQRMTLVSVVAVVAFGGLALGNSILVENNQAALSVRWAKGNVEGTALHETWNEFSRVRITNHPFGDRPFGWGMSSTLPDNFAVRSLVLQIDTFAISLITEFDGDLEDVEFLRYDVVNMAHYLRDDADVFIIGSGGGRDVLTALYFEQPSITAVELNGDILDAVNGKFGDFTGHLDQQPGVKFVEDEARSYLARTDDRYDLIQFSLIDTWAATGAGAFALSENSLYTVEAWDGFLDRLKPNGVLSVSRWFHRLQPFEGHRITALAAEVLRQRGVEEPRDHMLIVRNSPPGSDPIGTLLLSNEPFSQKDITTFLQVADELEFDVVMAPDFEGSDPVFLEIAETDDLDSVDLPIPADISPPTDDRPFFFQMIRFQDIFNRSIYQANVQYLTQPVLVLFSLTVAAVSLTLLFIVLPVLLGTRRELLQGMAPFMVFFCCIGLGFLLVEISQMQRLIIFLGHPTYALSVVLFSLLIFSGIGSLIIDRIAKPSARVTVVGPLVVLIIVLIGFGLLTPTIIDSFEAGTTPIRIATSVAILAPMGLLMGMPFPLGMKIATQRPNAPTAFFWAINGATSVCASVLAVVVALGWGISFAFWLGCASYLAAAVALTFAMTRVRT